MPRRLQPSLAFSVPLHPLQPGSPPPPPALSLGEWTQLRPSRPAACSRNDELGPHPQFPPCGSHLPPRNAPSYSPRLISHSSQTSSSAGAPTQTSPMAFT